MISKLSSDLTRAYRFSPLLVILFIGSGSAALIYEVVWLQMLQLVVGLTTLSLGILLTVFMGGMFLGSLLLPKFVSQKHHPLKVYAILELGIALFGLALLFGMPLIQNLYIGIGGYGLFSSILIRSLIAGLCLLPPTILMGATLPAIARWVESTPKGVSWMGFFYGGNIFGAVLGTVLAGFYLLREYDTAIATYVAVVINVFVASSAIILSRFTSYSKGQRNIKSPTLKINKFKVAYFVIALSGMTALGAEVIWTRLLAIMLGPTVYTFSIILAVFLVGLGIGSNTGAYLSRFIKSPGVALAACQFLIIFAIAWTSYMITRVVPNHPIDPELVNSSWYVIQFDLALSVMAILPSTLFWGASFPFALAAVASKEQDPGKLVGGVYAANTVGAILGSLTFSLIGIPILGTAMSQRVMVFIAATAAILMIFSVFSDNTTSTRKEILKLVSNFRLTGMVIFILVIASLVSIKITNIPWYSIAYARYNSNFNNLSLLTDSNPDPPGTGIIPLYVGEGLNGSVAVTEFVSTSDRQFHSVGKVQASTIPADMRLQRMLGHLSALLTEDPKSVLIVACGAGITAGSFLTYPEVENITVCDIESLVPKVVAPMFSAENYGIADGIDKENPHVVNGKNVRFIFDDGRHFVSTTDQKFDIISSDPVDPWVKGAAALYTVEYFETCKAHLNPGGITSLWVPLYETSEESVKSLFATFFEVFPDGIIWSNDINGQGYDTVLFGFADDQKHIYIDELNQKFNSENYSEVRQSLAEVGFYSPEDLLSTYAGRGKDLEEWMDGAKLNMDRNLKLSYLAGEAINSNERISVLSDIMKYYKFPEDLFIGTNQELEYLDQSIKYKM